MPSRARARASTNMPTDSGSAATRLPASPETAAMLPRARIMSEPFERSVTMNARGARRVASRDCRSSTSVPVIPSI